MSELNKFWNWTKNEDGGRTLYFDGVISGDTWFGDEITPEMFRKELFSGNGNVTVWINSCGGDCVAASQIYTMITDYRSGDVTVKIDGLAASAASVIAMAGTKVLISPTAMMMIHNPTTIAWGDSGEMKKVIEILNEYKQSIINAYEMKTGLSRVVLSHLMDAETWMSAHKAVELKFADGIIEDEKRRRSDLKSAENFSFSRQVVTNLLIDRIKRREIVSAAGTDDAAAANIGKYYERLYKLKTW